MELFQHQDVLTGLTSHAPVQDKMIQIHQAIKAKVPAIARVSVAILDADTRLIKTFLETNDGNIKLPHYEAKLDDSESLHHIYKNAVPRVINNFLELPHQARKKNERIINAGFLSSYTKPIYHNGQFYGFLFFNAKQPDIFNADVLNQLDVYALILGFMVVSELTTMNTMRAAFKTSGSLTRLRDPETGSHLERMSRYSRLIAKAIAPKYQLDSEYIEQIFMFAPLHDIGKIGIADDILMKPGKLTNEELEVMKTHSTIGREIIDDIIVNFRLSDSKSIKMVRNIIEFHHETIDGQGYPRGLNDERIPLEAKIVSVADIFDALTSDRPYKKAWSNEQALEYIADLGGKKLDQDCVDALLSHVDEIELIQKRFDDEDNIYA